MPAERHRQSPTQSTPERRVRIATTLLVALVLVLGLTVVPVSALAGTAPVSAAGGDAPEDDLRSDFDSVTGETVTVTVTPASLAAGVGDSVTLTGTASVDSLRLYLVGPRGRFLDADGTESAVEELTVDSGAFNVSHTAIDRRGSFVLLVVSPHDDGEFATTKTLGESSLPTGVSQDQAVTRVLSAYSGDEVLELTLHGESPRLSVDVVDTDGVVEYGTETTVSGGSNRGDGTTVTLALRNGAGRAVVVTEATVDAASAEWSTSLDTSSLEPGSYTLDVDDGVSATSTIVVVTTEETVTPSDTPVDRTTDSDGAADTAGEDGAVTNADETVENTSRPALENGTEGLDDETEVVGAGNANTTTNVTGNATTNAPANETGNANTTANATNSSASGGGETNESLPGFGVGAAVAAVVTVVVLSRRRGS